MFWIWDPYILFKTLVLDLVCLGFGFWNLDSEPGEDFGFRVRDCVFRMVFGFLSDLDSGFQVFVLAGPWQVVWQVRGSWCGKSVAGVWQVCGR